MNAQVFAALDNFLKAYAKWEKVAPEEADYMFQRLQEEVQACLLLCTL